MANEWTSAGHINGGNLDVLFFFFLGCTVFALVVIFFQDAMHWSYQTTAFVNRLKNAVNADTLPVWKVIKSRFRRPVYPNDSVEMTTIAYRSKLNPEVYGIELVDPSRFRQLGLVRRLRRYKRKNIIYVPEMAQGAVRCDGWANKANEDEQGEGNSADALKLHECRLDDGDAACFNCIESRRFLRTCVHIPMR